MISGIGGVAEVGMAGLGVLYSDTPVRLSTLQEKKYLLWVN
jgi:hypothetical protein